MWSPVLLLAAWVACVGGHGRVFVPPSRASAWRFGFGTPADYDDDGWNCGGYAVQQANGGKCGICGDAYNISPPRPHEIGGIYGQGVLVAGYLPGALITTTVDLTTSHKGFWEFKVCPDPQSNDQNCFDKYVLELEEGGTKYYPIRGSGLYNVTYRLPKGLVCEHCVLQWRYTAGNNWGTCANGTQGLGCGPQEQFGACSDIYIGTTKKHTRLVLEDGKQSDDQLNPWFFLNAPSGLLGMFQSLGHPSKNPQKQSTATNAHGQTQTTKIQQQKPTTKKQPAQTTTAIQHNLIKNPDKKPQVANAQRQSHTTTPLHQTHLPNVHSQAVKPHRLTQTTPHPSHQTHLSNAQQQSHAQRQSQAAKPHRLAQTKKQQNHVTTAHRQTTTKHHKSTTKPTTKKHHFEPTPSTRFITHLNQLLAHSLQHQKYNVHQKNKGTESTRHTTHHPSTIKHHARYTKPTTKTHKGRRTTQRVKNKKPTRNARQRDKTRSHHEFHHTTQPSHPTRHTTKYHRPLAFSNHKTHKSKQKLKAMRSKHNQKVDDNNSKAKKRKKEKDMANEKLKKRKKKTLSDHKASTHQSTHHYSKQHTSRP